MRKIFSYSEEITDQVSFRNSSGALLVCLSGYGLYLILSLVFWLLFPFVGFYHICNTPILSVPVSGRAKTSRCRSRIVLFVCHNVLCSRCACAMRLRVLSKRESSPREGFHPSLALKHVKLRKTFNKSV